MVKANDFENIKMNKKQEKYCSLINIQEKLIKENMAAGNNSVIFIFTDREYYHNDMERAWFEEFRKKAVDELKNNGFSISGILVTW